MAFTEKSLVYLSKDFRAPASFGAVGQSASAGGAPIVDNDDPALTDEETSKGVIFQEIFEADGVSFTFTVTENDGVLPETTSDIIITRNGLTLSAQYIASLNSQSGEVTLTFTPDSGDRIAVIWFFRGELPQGIFQEIITPSGSDDTFALTVNNGQIPGRPQELFLFLNGIFLDYKKLTAYNQEQSEFTLDFTPASDDTLACVWFTSLPNNLKIIQESFKADGTQVDFTVTKNGGKLAKVKDAILLLRNGQHINNDYISGINTSTGTLTMTFVPDEGDDIELIWFVEEFVTPSYAPPVKMFQEQFTTDGVSNTLTVTKNQGKLPDELDSIMIYRNGQHISTNFVSELLPLEGTIRFSFTPRINEKFTIVWVISTV